MTQLLLMSYHSMCFSLHMLRHIQIWFTHSNLSPKVSIVAAAHLVHPSNPSIQSHNLIYGSLNHTIITTLNSIPTPTWYEGGCPGHDKNCPFYSSTHHNNNCNMRYRSESPTTLTYLANDKSFVVREEKLTQNIQKCKNIAIHHSALCHFVNCDHFDIRVFAEYSQNIVHRKSNTMFSAVPIKRIATINIESLEFKLVDQKVSFTFNSKCCDSIAPTSQQMRFWLDEEHSAVMIADTQWCFHNIR